jgi:hypothetical protein
MICQICGKPIKAKSRQGAIEVDGGKAHFRCVCKPYVNPHLKKFAEEIQFWCHRMLAKYGLRLSDIQYDDWSDDYGCSNFEVLLFYEPNFLSASAVRIVIGARNSNLGRRSIDGGVMVWAERADDNNEFTDSVDWHNDPHNMLIPDSRMSSRGYLSTREDIYTLEVNPESWEMDTFGPQMDVHTAVVYVREILIPRLIKFLCSNGDIEIEEDLNQRAEDLAKDWGYGSWEAFEDTLD